MTPLKTNEERIFLAGGGEMGGRIREFDWSKTAIGSIDTWCPALRMQVSFLLANRFPVLLWWGPTFCSIYNDAYAPILGTKHPWALGKPVSECWSEIWDVLKPLIETPFNGGPSTWIEDFQLELRRHGYMEEGHFTVAYSPVPDETSPRGIGGVVATVHEISGTVFGERRVAALRDLGSRAGEAKTAEQACAIAAETLGAYSKDLPFVLLYLIDAKGTSAKLAGAAGVAEGEDISPASVELGESRGVGWPLAEARRREAMTVVDGLAARFSKVPPGPWSDAPETAIVTPIPSSKAHEPAGLLVAGVSSRLRLDEHYRDFFELLRTQLATAIGNARAYEEEKQRSEALAEIDRAKTAFFSNVSHEFRTPLTLMLGPVEDLLARSHTDLSPAATGQLELVHRNGLRLLRLVNTLLDFSRIEAGRVRAAFQATDLASFTADLASVFRAAVERAGLQLLVDCPPLSEPVFVDRDMWEKIVLNLLSNAFKYTFEGTVRVTLRAAGAHAELRVEDTGTGIPPEEMPALFERFHRVQNARGRTHEGSGIGLALVLELVKLHGGTILAESTVSEGTAFTIVVPLGSAHLPPDQIVENRALASTVTGASPYVEEALRWLPDPQPSADDVGFLPTHYESMPVPALDREKDRGGNQPRVLVADDNADMRQYVSRLLAERYRVEAVADGETALEAARKEAPDLVLTDVMMPKLDGFGLLRELRADARTRDIPVILLSARAGEESRVEGLDAGADDYLIKPFSAKELVARVSAHLQMARMRRDSDKALRESEARLKDADRRKDEFLAMLAHELRNPLAPIRTGLELLRLAGDRPETLERVRSMIERQVVHMVRLVDDLLDVSRISSGKIRLQRQPSALAALVNMAIEANRAALNAGQIDLRVELPQSPVWLDVDPTRFVQIVSNVLHNAVKFTDAGGRVAIEARRRKPEGSELELTVTDSGAGISKDMLPRVFDLFAQDDAIARPHTGLGIGLALARRLMEMHGGSIEAFSEGPGHGSVFTLRVPVLQEASSPEPSGPSESKHETSRRVLVIDDNTDAANAVAMLVSELGGESRVAGGGETGVQLALEFRPDVVLLDIRMPGMDGYETCRRIREKLGADTVIVALTGWGQERDTEKAARAGFDAHLTKPADPMALERLLADDGVAFTPQSPNSAGRVPTSSYRS